MRRRKLEMLAKTIRLCAASKLWKKLPMESKTQILGRFTTDAEKIQLIANSIELPKFDTKLGKNWDEFIKTVVSTKTEPVILTEEEVMLKHNDMRKAPWDMTVKEVRGLTLNQGKFLQVKHIPQGRIEV